MAVGVWRFKRMASELGDQFSHGKFIGFSDVIKKTESMILFKNNGKHLKINTFKNQHSKKNIQKSTKINKCVYNYFGLFRSCFD